VLPKLEFNEALTLLRNAVEEKGKEYIYPDWEGDCHYFEGDGTPSCIVGYVLAAKGVTKADLVDDQNEDSVHELGITADEKTETLLMGVQRWQDVGIPWGTALQKALGAIKEIYGEDV
jgi:hypothetical protein